MKHENTRNTQRRHLELTANTLLGIQLPQFKPMKFKVFCKQYNILTRHSPLVACCGRRAPSLLLFTYYQTESYFSLYFSHFSSRPSAHTSSTREDSWSQVLAALEIKGLSLLVHSSSVLFNKHIITPGYGLNIDSSWFTKHSALLWHLDKAEVAEIYGVGLQNCDWSKSFNLKEWRERTKDTLNNRDDAYIVNYAGNWVVKVNLFLLPYENAKATSNWNYLINVTNVKECYSF